MVPALWSVHGASVYGSDHQRDKEGQGTVSLKGSHSEKIFSVVNTVAKTILTELAISNEGLTVKGEKIALPVSLHDGAIDKA